jgi:hypothetical protein
MTTRDQLRQFAEERVRENDRDQTTHRSLNADMRAWIWAGYCQDSDGEIEGTSISKRAAWAALAEPIGFACQHEGLRDCVVSVERAVIFNNPGWVLVVLRRDAASCCVVQ